MVPGQGAVQLLCRDLAFLELCTALFVKKKDIKKNKCPGASTEDPSIEGHRTTEGARPFVHTPDDGNTTSKKRSFMPLRQEKQKNASVESSLRLKLVVKRKERVL